MGWRRMADTLVSTHNELGEAAVGFDSQLTKRDVKPVSVRLEVPGRTLQAKAVRRFLWQVRQTVGDRKDFLVCSAYDSERNLTYVALCEPTHG